MEEADLVLRPPHPDPGEVPNENRGSWACARGLAIGAARLAFVLITLVAAMLRR